MTANGFVAISLLLLVAWLVAALLLLRGVASLQLLKAVAAATNQPSISIIIAARNEAHTIERALLSVLAADYTDYEVIVVDDRSTDDTGVILDRVAAANARLRVIHNTDLPGGWLGKNYAMHMAAQAARGDYLLFTDADVHFAPSAIARAMQYVQQHDLGHVAVAPEMTPPDYWTGCMFGEFLLSFLLFTQPWRVRNPRSRAVMGIGAFNLVRAVTYRQVGGHTRIAMRPDDDIKLGQILKQAGVGQDVLIGTDILRVEWYSSVGEMVRGLEKNSFAVLEYSVLPTLGAVGLHFACNVLPWLLLLFGAPAVRMVSAATIGAMFVTWGGVGRLSRIGLRYFAGKLFASVIFEYTILRAAALALRRGGIRWRDTAYSLGQLKSNRIRND